jgi:hypothetical protein
MFQPVLRGVGWVDIGVRETFDLAAVAAIDGRDSM